MNGLEKLGYRYKGKKTYFDSTTQYDNYVNWDGDVKESILIDKNNVRKLIDIGSGNKFTTFTHKEILAVAEILKEKLNLLHTMKQCVYDGNTQMINKIIKNRNKGVTCLHQ